MVNGGMSGVSDFCDIGLISRRFDPFAFVPLRSAWITSRSITASVNARLARCLRCPGPATGISGWQVTRRP